jgi:hypothetical protein
MVFRSSSLKLIIVVLVLISALSANATFAEDKPTRTKTMIYTSVFQTWQLRWWSTDELACKILVPHTDTPGEEELYQACGSDIYNAWRNTPPCDAARTNGDTNTCDGLYLWYEGEQAYEVEELINLPRPAAYAASMNCRPGLRCSQHPEMTFSGYEPLPNYDMAAMHIIVGGEEIVCPGASCTLRLPETGERGTDITYFARSTYGDTSDPEKLLVRMTFLGESLGYRYEVMGGAWSAISPACAVMWDVFPPSAGTPDWLGHDVLETSYHLSVLAGHLVWTGDVDAKDEQINDAVFRWQNNANEYIRLAAEEVRIPAMVLKGVIAQETQFWTKYESSVEFGDGRITEDGADMLLAWNLPLYQKICIPRFGYEACMAGYHSMPDAGQETLRADVLRLAASDDPQQRVGIVANTLLASCAQTDQVIRNAVGYEPRILMDYPNLWKLTLANYHSGSGCLQDALLASEYFPHHDEGYLTWSRLSEFYSDGCVSALNYVEKVVGYARGEG